MVVVKLSGGLGNQLFEYAIGRNLALLRNTNLKLDQSTYHEDKRRVYELGHFKIKAEQATSADLQRFRWSPAVPRPIRGLRRVLSRVLPRFRYTLYTESEAGFDPTPFYLAGNLLLQGYWQDERFFKRNEAAVRADLTLREPLSSANQPVADQIAATPNAVSVHVRRTDYMTLTDFNLCTPEYYANAFAHIRANVAAPHYFVFSDEPEWPRAMLRFDAPVTFVSGNGAARAHEELWLMRLCRHHITPNSTFGWWGAWLDPAEDNIVIGPRRWTRSNRPRFQGTVPERWVRI